jgi:alanine-synthesizing transaminase
VPYAGQSIISSSRPAAFESRKRIRQAARGVKRFFESADATLHNVVKLKQPA